MTNGNRIMKKTAVFTLLALALGTASAAQADDMFSGDTKLACEAVLCLSTGQRPSECSPSLRRYFSIDHRKLKDTIKARRNFLQLCPAASYDDNMSSLVDAIANGAGRCDAAALNSYLMRWNMRDNYRTISDRMPNHCNAYNQNAYSDLPAARYVGTPERNGFWVNAEDYDQALADYNARGRR